MSALGYKVNDFEGHIDFDLRDNIRAEQVKLGMLPDGNPTAAFLERLGVQGAVISARHFAVAVAVDAFGFEADHFEQVAERVEPAPPRHGGEVGRHGRHIIGDLGGAGSPVALLSAMRSVRMRRCRAVFTRENTQSTANSSL